ncbi:MAG TPA: hypothetical protein GXZ22_08900 [Clostridiaceae bacterium]|nr:hypothetical protein [Clostridiaceae bacterium]
MNRTEEKLNKFSYMVMKEADAKKKELISQAEKDRIKTIAEKEIMFLKKAYDQIHESLARIEKEHNEEVSKAILESKQTLFNNREEILKQVFSNVRGKLEDFKHKDEYRSYMIKMILQSLEQIGKGDILIYADSDDIPLIEEIKAKSGVRFELFESEEQLVGGFIICNKTKGLMYNYSFINGLKQERDSFLENYGLSID